MPQVIFEIWHDGDCFSKRVELPMMPAVGNAIWTGLKFQSEPFVVDQIELLLDSGTYIVSTQEPNEYHVDIRECLTKDGWAERTGMGILEYEQRLRSNVK